MVGCTVSELGERMTSEEFAWWTVMLAQEWIGPAKQSRLLAHIAAGVRNGQVQGPDGKDSLWTADHFMPSDRWDPPKRAPTMKEMRAAIRSWFQSRRYGKKG